MVRKQDNVWKNSRALNLKRKRDVVANSDSRDLQEAFDSIVQQARVWMAGDAVPADDPAEDSDEVGMSDQEDKPDPLTEELFGANDLD